MSLDDVFGVTADVEALEVERVKLDYAFALERLRKIRRLSYKEVARLYGKSAGYISRVFRGDENVTIATMVKLARVLGGKLRLEIDDSTVQPSLSPRHVRFYTFELFRAGQDFQRFVVTQSGSESFVRGTHGGGAAHAFTLHEPTAEADVYAKPVKVGEAHV